ncbi:MAG: 50S ribosomal protein L19e domain-containing protein, partial [Candidatus Syntropharchaeia archaeon]
MTDLSNQRRLAADILGVGIKRVWLNPELVEEIAAALTREDIRGLIESGAIKRKQKKGVSRGRARMLARKR